MPDVAYVPIDDQDNISRFRCCSTWNGREKAMGWTIATLSLLVGILFIIVMNQSHPGPAPTEAPTEAPTTSTTPTTPTTSTTSTTTAPPTTSTTSTTSTASTTTTTPTNATTPATTTASPPEKTTTIEDQEMQPVPSEPLIFDLEQTPKEPMTVNNITKLF